MNPEDRLRELRDPDRWQSVRLPRASAREDGRPMVAPARVAQLVVAFAIAIAVVVGLMTGLVALRASSPPAATPTPSATAGPVAPTTFFAVPGATHVYSNSVLPSACTLAQLATDSKQDGGGAAGSYIQDISLQNSGADCLLATDAVHVGGTVARFVVPRASHGLVVPALALARLTVVTAEACQPGGTANIDSAKPVLPIVVTTGGRSRTMSARFPQGTCAKPSAEAFLVDGGEAKPSPAGLVASLTQPSKTPRGGLQYDVSVRPAGSDARRLTACPVATEVLSNALGTLVTRALTLRCTIGATLQPDVPVTIPVTTTIPSNGDWTIFWYLGGGSTTSVASTTCTLAQLHVSEPGPGGPTTGDWVQLISIHNRGGECTLPVTAVSLSGRVARAGQSRDAGGVLLQADSTIRISVLTNIGCGDGSGNVGSTRSLGPNAKPLILQLGGHDAVGLDQPFPVVACAGLFVSRLD